MNPNNGLGGMGVSPGSGGTSSGGYSGSPSSGYGAPGGSSNPSNGGGGGVAPGSGGGGSDLGGGIYRGGGPDMGSAQAARDTVAANAAADTRAQAIADAHANQSGLSRALQAANDPAALQRQEQQQYQAPALQSFQDPSNPFARNARIAAITRGPGLSDPSGYQKAITAATTYPESPSGSLDPAFNAALNTAALQHQSLFNFRGATPAQQALVNQIGPDALLAAGGVGLDARTLMSQALTESTTSRNPTKVSSLAAKANNLFGIKAVGQPNPYWNGTSVSMPTKEMINGVLTSVPQLFRSYTTPSQSLYDYARLMSTPRYASALDGKQTVADQISAIRGAGYATHPPAGYNSLAMANNARLLVGGVPISSPSYQIASSTAVAAPKVPSAPSSLSEIDRIIQGINANKAQAAGTLTAPYNLPAQASGTLTSPYNKVAQAAGTLTEAYNPPAQTAVAAGTLTAPFNRVDSSLLQEAQQRYAAAQLAKQTTIAVRPNVPVGALPAATEDLTRAAYDAAHPSLPFRNGVPNTSASIGFSGRPNVPVGSLPPANSIQSLIASRPNVPVGTLPAARLQEPTRLPAPPQVPVSSQDITQSPIYNIMPNFSKVIAPVNAAMGYYAKNKWAINSANALGLLKKPVNNIVGSGISAAQQYVRDYLQPVKDVPAPKKGNVIAGGNYFNDIPSALITPTKVATAPEKVIASSPELQKVAETSPSFLQRLFSDSGKGGAASNKFVEYLKTIASVPSSSGSLSANDTITKMFADLVSGNSSASTTSNDAIKKMFADLIAVKSGSTKPQLAVE